MARPKPALWHLLHINKFLNPISDGAVLPAAAPERLQVANPACWPDGHQGAWSI